MLHSLLPPLPLILHADVLAWFAPTQVDIVGGRATLAGAELVVTVQSHLHEAWFVGDAFRLRQASKLGFYVQD